VGGETFTGASTTIQWTEAYAGASVGSRRIEFSDDGGDSWNLVTAAAGASPYTWDISALPSGTMYRVRVTVVDDGTPTLMGVDNSDADFTITRPGGDTHGPVVVAGSITSSPNPVVAPGNFVLAATVDDSRSGASNIAAAEWSLGACACPAGAGTAMSGLFTSRTVTVRDTVDAATLSAGWVPLWIRGRDAAGSGDRRTPWRCG